MNFLKRYYDKVILLVLFVVFVVLMLYVSTVVDQTKEVTDDKLRLTRAKSDPDTYGKFKETDLEFQYSALWNESRFNWQKSSRGEGASDLLEIEQLAECPYCTDKNAKSSGGKVLVPRRAFGNKCHNIHADGKSDLPLPELQSGGVIGGAGGLDSDGDGISDADEEKYKMNKDDKLDALYDSDGDGFSNRYEIAKSTDPTDAASHPPLWHRLKVSKIAAARLPVKLLGVNTYPKNGVDSPKEDWEIFCRVPKFNKRKGWQLRDTTIALGNKINVDYDENVKYLVVDVIKNVGADKNIDFVVKLEEVIPKNLKMEPHNITMTSGKYVYSWDARPVIQDTGRPGSAPIIKAKGGTFTIYRLENSKHDNYHESFEIEDFQISNGVVTLRRVGSEEKLQLTREGEIPRRDVVRAKTEI